MDGVAGDNDKSDEDLRRDLAIIKAQKESRLESNLLYADRIVQKIVFWTITIVAGALLLAGVNLVVQALLKAVALP